MSLETIYYISQTLAVFAILASLVFVGYQTTQTNTIARTEITRALLEETRVFADSMSSSPEFAEFIFNCRAATEELPPAQRFRLNMFYASWLTVVESAFKVHQQKLIEPSVYEHIRSTTRTFDCFNMRLWWENARDAYAPDFAADVDHALEQW